MWVHDAEAAARHRASSSVSLHLISVRQGLSLDEKSLTLARLAGRGTLQICLCQVYRHAPMSFVVVLFCFVFVLGVSAGDSHSGPHACRATFLTPEPPPQSELGIFSGE